MSRFTIFIFCHMLQNSTVIDDYISMHNKYKWYKIQIQYHKYLMKYVNFCIININVYSQNMHYISYKIHTIQHIQWTEVKQSHTCTLSLWLSCNISQELCIRFTSLCFVLFRLGALVKGMNRRQTNHHWWPISQTVLIDFTHTLQDKFTNTSIRSSLLLKQLWRIWVDNSDKSTRNSWHYQDNGAQ